VPLETLRECQKISYEDRADRRSWQVVGDNLSPRLKYFPCSERLVILPEQIKKRRSATRPFFCLPECSPRTPARASRAGSSHRADRLYGVDIRVSGELL